MEHFRNDSLESFGEVEGVLRLLIGDALCQFDEVGVLEGWSEGCQLKEGHSQTPDVHLLTVGFILYDFRRQVQRSAHSSVVLTL